MLQIDAYIDSLQEPKRREMQQLHDSILALNPACKMWFLDGKNSEGKVVANPNIGFGSQHIKYADGSQKEFYQVGISANTTGISVYIMGLPDKSYLVKEVAPAIGKAKVSGYCIKFKSLQDINLEVLKAACLVGFGK